MVMGSHRVCAGCRCFYRTATECSAVRFQVNRMQRGACQVSHYQRQQNFKKLQREIVILQGFYRQIPA